MALAFSSAAYAREIDSEALSFLIAKRGKAFYCSIKNCNAIDDVDRVRFLPLASFWSIPSLDAAASDHYLLSVADEVPSSYERHILGQGSVLDRYRRIVLATAVDDLAAATRQRAIMAVERDLLEQAKNKPMRPPRMSERQKIYWAHAELVAELRDRYTAFVLDPTKGEQVSLLLQDLKNAQFLWLEQGYKKSIGLALSLYNRLIETSPAHTLENARQRLAASNPLPTAPKAELRPVVYVNGGDSLPICLDCGDGAPDPITIHISLIEIRRPWLDESLLLDEVLRISGVGLFGGTTLATDRQPIANDIQDSSYFPAISVYFVTVRLSESVQLTDVSGRLFVVGMIVKDLPAHHRTR